MFKEELIKQLITNRGKIEFQEQIGNSCGYLSIASLNGSQITSNTTTDKAKVRFQHLIFDVNEFTTESCRMNNHNKKSLNEHDLIFGTENFIGQTSTGKIILKILGSEFNDVEVFNKPYLEHTDLKNADNCILDGTQKLEVFDEFKKTQELFDLIVKIEGEKNEQ